MTQGFLYVACGDKYIDEALLSAASLRKVDPKADITMVVDRHVESDLINNVIVKPFERTRWIENLSYKTAHMYDCSPYERTIFLDSDTYLCEPIQELFDLLDYFDLCAAQAPYDQSYPIVFGRCLTGYAPFNTGVLVFKKNSINERVFASWHRFYSENLASDNRRGCDQEYLNTAILLENAKVCVLPNNYNARTVRLICVKNKVKVIHGHHKYHSRVSSVINRSSGARMWHPVFEKWPILAKQFDWIVYHLQSENSIRKLITKPFEKLWSRVFQRQSTLSN